MKQSDSSLALASQNVSNLIDQDPAPDVDELLRKGLFDEAASWCGARISSHPDDYVPFLHLGKLAERAGDLQRSAEFFAEAIVRNADCGIAYWELSRMLHALGQRPFAARSLQMAIALKAAPKGAQLELADMLFELGDRAAAQHAYAAALAENPTCSRSRAVMKLLGAQVPPESQVEANDSGAASPWTWRKVNIAVVAPNGFSHWQGFLDVAQSFSSAFQDLGIECAISLNEFAVDRPNILFGGHLIQSHDMASRVPQNTILFNLEQIAGFGLEKLPVYKDLLRRFVVWDYSERNIRRLKELTGNISIHRVGIGFTPALVRISKRAQQTTDVLFYGSLNARRSVVLEEMRSIGLTVKHAFNVYGAALDDEIANAKVVLNMHYYQDSIHEIVRTSLLMANRKAIVTECNLETEIDQELRSAMLAVPYSELAHAAASLVRNDADRLALEDRAFQIFSQRSQEAFLKSAMSLSPHR